MRKNAADIHACRRKLKIYKEALFILCGYKFCPNSNILCSRESAAYAGHVLLYLDCLHLQMLTFHLWPREKKSVWRMCETFNPCLLVNQGFVKSCCCEVFAFVSQGDCICIHNVVFKSKLEAKALIKSLDVYWDSEI